MAKAKNTTPETLTRPISPRLQHLITPIFHLNEFILTAREWLHSLESAEKDAENAEMRQSDRSGIGCILRKTSTSFFSA